MINLNSFRVVCLWVNGWHKIDYSWINCHNVKHLAQWAHWQGWYRQRSECRMSRKWTLNQPELENCLGYLSAFILSVCLSLCLCLSLFLSLCVSLCLCLCLSTSLIFENLRYDTWSYHYHMTSSFALLDITIKNFYVYD